MTVSTRTRPPGLLVVPGSVVGEVLAAADAECRDIVARVYAEHVVDDVSHALRERTSLGLAVAAGLVDADAIVPVGALFDGALPPEPERTVIYSPFGLGSLDIALAQLVLERSRDLPGVVAVPDFAGA
jgi:ornithine cyclodeaminase/alanine dehydrogenase-like protein (mu-crystallin family)